MTEDVVEAHLAINLKAMINVTQSLKKNKSLSNIIVHHQATTVALKSKRQSSCNNKVASKHNKSSPEKSGQKFHPSNRNYYPRQNHFKTEKRKFNLFDYFSNNYFPSKVSPRKNQITLEYYNLSDSAPKKDIIIGTITFHDVKQTRRRKGQL